MKGKFYFSLALILGLLIFIHSAGAQDLKRQNRGFAQQHHLTVINTGAGYGTVTSSPSGINCNPICKETFPGGTKVDLKAEADNDFSFAGWAGGGCTGIDPCSPIMDSDVTVTAVFNAGTPKISLSTNELDFTIKKAGKKVTQTLVISNIGTANLIVTVSGLDGTDFRISGKSTFTIRPGKSYNLKVNYTPSASQTVGTEEVDTEEPAPGTKRVEIEEDIKRPPEGTSSEASSSNETTMNLKTNDPKNPSLDVGLNVIGQPLVYDCTPATGCQQLSVNGDPVNTNSSGGFYGNLDPCIRRDPNGNHELYFMYSFPMVVPGASTPTIEIHLASSTDHGATWNFLANVWPYVQQPDGNYSSHEVSNLAAQNVNGTTVWYGISHYYEVPPGGSSANPQHALYVEPVFTGSTYYVLSKAIDPAHLGSPMDSQVLICGGTTGDYASLSDPNLTSISGDSNAVTWREPALLVQGDVLYLVAQAANANGIFSYIGVFAARTSGPMSTWNWKYLGKLFNDSDPALVLPSAGHPIFTEIDLTQKPNGQIISIMTAMDLANSQKYGSRTAEVVTLGDYDTDAAPAMVRDSQGRLIITGQFTASDLNVPPNEGPGASTYEAMEPGLGVLIARRYMLPNVHGFTFNTGEHP